MILSQYKKAIINPLGPTKFGQNGYEFISLLVFILVFISFFFIHMGEKW